ncbi:hypothetical protein GE061_014369 [Apolygus lucorum]|uniref:Uncharacterized protein n=1 Tax=Apolygus lucorum TaxID=248454 RepID=A0A8S9XQB5_APOLU|nr:hypothetical protein GE061_014369 [Apolygus lucorum]
MILKSVFNTFRPAASTLDPRETFACFHGGSMNIFRNALDSSFFPQQSSFWSQSLRNEPTLPSQPFGFRYQCMLSRKNASFSSVLLFCCEVPKFS